MEAAAGPAPEERAEELAYHFDQARDPERARRYHEAAALQPGRLFAFSRAVQHLERAIELAADDEPSLGDLQLRLADAAEHASGIPRAARAAEEARGLFQAAGDLKRSGAALGRLARHRWNLGDTRAASELAAEAVRMLEPLGESPELAAAYGELARLALLDARNTEAVERGQRAIEMARTTGALEVRVAALNTVGAAMARSDPAGVELIRESLNLALEHELAWHADRAYNNLVVRMDQHDAPYGNCAASTRKGCDMRTATG